MSKTEQPAEDTPKQPSGGTPTETAVKESLTTFMEPAAVAVLAAWFAAISGINPTMDFSQGADNLTAALGGGLPRPICAGIHWILCMVASFGVLCLLSSVVPEVGNRKLMGMGAALMTAAVVYNTVVTTLASGFSVLQLLQSVLFAVSMNRLPQIAVVDEGDSLFINWLITTRPWSFSAILLPVAVTAASLVWWGIEIKSAGLATEVIMSMILMQVAANQMNSLADYRNGVDRADLPTSDTTVLSGLLSVRALTVSSVASLVASLLIVAHSIRDMEDVYFNIDKLMMIVAVIVTYTVSPFPLKYIGLGDAAVFIFFGPINLVHFTLAVTAAEQSYSRLGDLLLFTLPVSIMVTVILSANNIRDMDGDWEAGCYTLEGMLGRTASRVYFAGLVMTAQAISAWLAFHKRVCLSSEDAEYYKFIDQSSAHTLLILGLTTALGISSVSPAAQVSIPGLLFSCVLIGLLHAVG
ncbi:1,4-dihydroxy-2-naphthoate octaprenyltransferase, putative [Perkinsus marinus ATCC 50983]|uniref:1,4-dihydroxy-2-naphthoate octaprenyltransferase, putative n=1 Tax=Perkinsus marinus (strain ATCC 50983 / TXsc) TaxID=423536 RepID=C5KUX2_PERM5|nr:1,4-dihydroxy-2-naphthoate octaprenyltransferase, putative [Perkinsus marinus ATCC 50983]EER11687.1 1,4-dihydroxy-2-naphthoate octaprenyltransferase, putative [Perkinsus marinus ATCC 50983]|eukprot:XP_002779892.1 1,4-dihydroxy-2-naphthoate octaprenyltransferase, putative [Perkinsus marinus ATCC 50983]